MRTPIRARSSAARCAAAVALISISALAIAGCSSADSGSATPIASPSDRAVAVNEEARALLPADLVESGELRMTADFQYPPFVYMEDGEYAGMDFELGNHIAESLGLEPVWSTESNFGSIVPSVQNGRVDAALESMNINPERLQAVSFVGYVTTYDVLLVPDGNPGDLDPSNLCGANMALTTGGATNPLLIAYSEACVAAGDPAITITEFANTDATILALTNERIDGYAIGSAVAPLRVDATNGQLEALGAITKPDTDELMRSAVAGVVIAKDRTGLGPAIQIIIEQMQEDGTHLALLEKFGFDESAMVPAEFVE